MGGRDPLILNLVTRWRSVVSFTPWKEPPVCIGLKVSSAPKAVVYAGEENVFFVPHSVVTKPTKLFEIRLKCEVLEVVKKLCVFLMPNT